MNYSPEDSIDQLELQQTNSIRLLQRQKSVVLSESVDASEEGSVQSRNSDVIRRRILTVADPKQIKRIVSSFDPREYQEELQNSVKRTSFTKANRESFMLKTQQRKQRNALMVESLVPNRDTIKSGPVELELLYDDAGDYRELLWAYNHPCLQQIHQLGKYIPILDPVNRYMMIWKIFLLVIVLFYFFEIPVYFAWGNVFWMSTVSNLTISLIIGITALFLIVDILLELVTAYYHNGNLVRKKDKVLLNYLKNNFTFDMIAVLSFIARGSMDSDQARWVYFMFYFKIPWVLKVDEQFQEILLLHKRMRTFYGIFKIIMTMFFCFTFYGCLFFLLGLHGVKEGYNSWVINPGNFGVILNLDVREQLFFSFYFSLGTLSSTMGYGDITPLNPYECVYCLFGIMFGVMVFAININFIQRILEEYQEKQKRQFDAKTAINRFMKRKSIPSDLQERVRQYLNEHWNTQAARDLQLENETILELAPELREELIYNAYGNFLYQVPLFLAFKLDFLKAISLHIKEVQYSEGEIIFQDHNQLKETDNAFYYIFVGSVLIYPEYKHHHNDHSLNQKHYLKKLEKGEYFGELGFIMGQGRTASAQASSYSQLYNIARDDFITTLRRFPDEFEKFHCIKDKIIFGKSHDVIDTECWTCGSNEHYATKCSTSHYQPDLQMSLMKLGFRNYDQPRVQFERGDRQQWKTLTKLKLLVKVSTNNKVKKAAAKVLQLKPNKLSSMFQVIKESKNSKILEEQEILSSEYIQKEMRSTFGIYSQDVVQKVSQDFDKPRQYKYYFPEYNINNIWSAQGVLIQNNRNQNSNYIL